MYLLLNKKDAFDNSKIVYLLNVKVIMDQAKPHPFNEVLQIVFAELQFQFDEANGWQDSSVPSLEAEILKMEYHLHRARSLLYHNKGVNHTQHALRIVSATSLRCLKNHGCPARIVDPPPQTSSSISSTNISKIIK